MKRHKHKRSPILPLFPVPTGRKKGSIRRRIIAVGVVAGCEYALHATKGYRSTRA